MSLHITGPVDDDLVLADLLVQCIRSAAGAVRIFTGRGLLLANTSSHRLELDLLLPVSILANIQHKSASLVVVDIPGQHSG